eukprot:2065964-Lingulodinium_polyedra.AAC.1
MVPPDMLGDTIRDCVPADIHDGWKEIQRAAEGRELSADARKAATWIERHGAAIGLRTANVQE